MVAVGQSVMIYIWDMSEMIQGREAWGEGQGSFLASRYCQTFCVHFLKAF
jgi:hypothetical protein